MTLHTTSRDPSSVDVVSELRNDLLGDDPERRRIAAACVRASRDARDVARRTNTKIITTVDGTVVALDPDSPLLVNLDELLELADRLVPA